MKIPPDIPPQNNSSDCEVFLLRMVKYLVMKKDFDFDTDCMKDIRKMIQTELKNQQLDMNVEKYEPTNSMKFQDLELLPMLIDRDTPILKESIMLGIQKSPNSDLDSLSNSTKDSERIANKKSKSGETVQCFTFNNFGLEIVVETVGKKVTCITCLEMFA